MHHIKWNHTCNTEGEGEAAWNIGGLGSSCNLMFGSPWLRFSSSEHPGCRMLCIRLACGKLLALSMLHLPPLWECFYWKDNRPYRANSLIPDPSPQTVQDTSRLLCPWKPNFTYNITQWISAHVTALSFIYAFLTEQVLNQKKAQINQSIDHTACSRLDFESGLSVLNSINTNRSILASKLNIFAEVRGGFLH